jgi:hypothetical protein
LFLLLAAFATLTILTLSQLPVASAWQWIGYSVVSVHTAWLLWRDVALRSCRSCIAFAYDKDRRVSLELRNGEQASGVVRSDTLVLPWLVLLNVAISGQGVRSLLLFTDAMPADAHRRLRVLLRNA